MMDMMRAEQNLRKRYRKRFLSRTGFTLIEVMMITLITALLVVGTLHISIFVIKNTFYLPNQVNADFLAASAIETMIEGDPLAHGLRFCKSVTVASVNEVTFNNQDAIPVDYTLNTGTGVLSRNINGAGAVQIPAGIQSNMKISGVGGSLFSYYDATDTAIATPVTAGNLATIRRIAINIIVQNGTGSSDNLAGRSQQSSSVKVNYYT